MEIVLLFFVVVFIMMNPWLIPLVILLWFIGAKLKKKYDGSDFGKKQQAMKNKRIVNAAEELKRKLNSKGVYPTFLVENRYSHVYIDENNRKIFLKLLYEDVVLNFDDIVRYEIITETGGNLQYTLGTAVTGKFQQNVTVSSIFVYIYLNSISRPFVKVLCLGNGTNYNQSSMEVFEANEFANKLIGALDYIKTNETTERKPLLNLVPNLQTEYIPSEKKVKPTKNKRKGNKINLEVVNMVDEKPEFVVPVDEADEAVTPIDEPVEPVSKKATKKNDKKEEKNKNDDNEEILSVNKKLKKEIEEKQKEIEELQRKISKAEKDKKNK